MMSRNARILGWLGLFTAGSLLVGHSAPTAADNKLDFLRDVRPILANHCFKCHGPDEEARKSKLRLDIREDALKPAKSGELAIVPNHPEQSELVKRIFAQDEDDLMPPPA